MILIEASVLGGSGAKGSHDDNMGDLSDDLL